MAQRSGAVSVAAACAVADLNGDRRPDLICTGGSSLKWCEDLGTGK